jgi:hypothetical protein
MQFAIKGPLYLDGPSPAAHANRAILAWMTKR